MSDVKVTLTLRGPIAEKLRAMCHKRGVTASVLIDKWILSHDANGDPVGQKRGNIDDIIEKAFGRR